MAGNRGASNPGEGAAQDHFQGIPLDHGANEVIPQIMKDGAGDFGSQWPFLMTGAEGGFFQGQDQPWLVQTGGLASRGGDQRQRPIYGIFSGHRGF